MLAPTDEEWKALQPKVEKLLTARDAAGTGRMMMGGMGGGRGGAAPAPAEGAVVTPVEKATNDLRTTLDNQSAKPEEIKAKLTALREAREKAKQDLAKAQGDLREALSLRQESQCVLMGMLD